MSRISACGLDSGSRVDPLSTPSKGDLIIIEPAPANRALVFALSGASEYGSFAGWQTFASVTSLIL